MLPATFLTLRGSGARSLLRRISLCVHSPGPSHSHAYTEVMVVRQVPTPTFVSGVILVLSMWCAKRNGTSSDPGAAGLPSPPGINNAMLATYGFSAPTPPSTPPRYRARRVHHREDFSRVTVSAPVPAPLVLSEACLTCRGWKWSLADIACRWPTKKPCCDILPTISLDGQFGVDWESGIR